MPAKYQDWSAESHGLGTPDRTCLRGIKVGLQDLTGKAHPIEPAYKVYMPAMYQVRAAGSHGFGKPDHTCLRGIRTGMQDLTGSEQQIVHA